MKKLLLTFAIVTIFGITASAQRDAFFTWNDADNEIYRNGSNDPSFVLPQAHGNDFDSEAPLGSGLLTSTRMRFSSSTGTFPAALLSPV